MVKKKVKTNPNKSNQHKPDPRQTLFLSKYFDPKSPTFSDAYNSAIAAGYSERYAANITHLLPKWLSESIGDDYLIRRAEQNLKEFVEMETKEPAMAMFGPIKDENGNIIMKENTKLKSIKADITKFTLERLNKKKYSTRTEHTGKDGETLFEVVRSNETN